MVMRLVCCNGAWSPRAMWEDDLGLQRSQGILDVLEARYGADGPVFFHWEDHWRRLFNACIQYPSINHFALPTKENVKKTVKQMIVKSGLTNARVKIIITTGRFNDADEPVGEPKVLLEVGDMPRQAFSFGPFKLATENAHRDLPMLKLTAGYGFADFYEAKARRAGYDSFLYWSSRNGILEGPRENVFFITNDNELVTPETGVLYGVTRKILLKLARESGLFTDVSERGVHKKDLEYCREAFLSSTLKGVAEVSQIDDRYFPVGSAGPQTLSSKLKSRFMEYRENYYKERGA